jgi:hypothetical protein
MIKRLLYKPFFIRLLNWEYWPFHVVYGPMYVYWLWLCIKSRSFFFFNTSNPTIKNGGFLMESKWDIYNMLPAGTYPETIFFSAGTRSTEIVDAVYRHHLQYPLVGKPDIGMQGIAVKKLDNEADLLAYAATAKVDFLIQEFVSLQHELGIFYYRYPNEEKGHISGIVNKEFLAVKGDGYSSIEELLMKDKRYILQLPVLRRTYGIKLKRVLVAGEKFILVPYGNHVRGAKFLDDTHLADQRLVEVIDKLCRQVNGFYYGRLDIRYNTWEELREGKNFSIIELNGAGSEPTHIYDPRHTVFFAWKEIFRHWKILWKISDFNHKKNKQPYMTTRTGLNMLKENKAYVKMIADNSRKRA